MKSSGLLIIVLLIIPICVIGQEPGFIKDKDGYTNIRKEQSSKSAILGRILEGQRFLYYPNSDNSWWKVEFSNNETTVIGYLNKLRIKPEYENGENSGLSNKKLYHEFERTASSFRTSKRNISPSELPVHYFVETIDNKGRVIDIRFMYKGKIIDNHLCYLAPWVKYEYPDPYTVISYNLNSDGSKLSDIECDLWYKSTYTLNAEQTKILNTHIEYSIDTAQLIKYGWEKEELFEALNDLRNRDQPKPIMINDFDKSSSKLNGKFPISDDFNIEIFKYSGLVYEELKSIIK
ncbi:SH3 domain-containing protein [Roseivirga sp.]|uniref:SH3 domain-containing protein n=1 Tax=Roseivirga sp. TaxID=1964215 RepID=UPI002B2681E5|nr:SH3 domain-containing protein [Roseivirga sp.]